jgi:hypothetical protein
MDILDLSEPRGIRGEFLDLIRVHSRLLFASIRG